MRKASLIIPAATLLAVTACANASQPEANSQEAYPLTVDNCGEDQIIESKPETILTIGTAAISLLDAAGATDRIVARAGEFGADLPTDLQHEPTDAEIIDPSDPTTEKIIGANADIIVGYGLFNADDADLEDLGIPNLVIFGECSHDTPVGESVNFEAVITDIERLATVFDTLHEAAPALADFRSELADLDAAASEDISGSAAGVYYFSATGDISAFGGYSMLDDIFGRIGLDHVYGDETAAYVSSGIETLLDADPEYIVISYGIHGESAEEATQRFLSEPGAADLQAVTNDNVILVPNDDLTATPDALRGYRAIIEATQ
ncbi:ABC transporter substrate-binding protein [Natronoglycomyces albus]|uniref:ABC transporter substrate-binding protein n=1 Tax=Natronoglycomyces albus TaxID=2811108 RepID=A0A895XFS0_9ACTN|nr:ABC transporter substrate-binding protein [Natronoglycomyces albus]QSB04174.1 ABC transporter substrate-binding protein [Natronoglycomyces albus]